MNPPDLFSRQSLPDPPDAGGECGAVAFGLIGEAAKHPLHRISQVVERGRFHRIGNAKRQADAVDKVVAKAAQDQRTHASRIFKRQKGRDPRCPLNSP